MDGPIFIRETTMSHYHCPICEKALREQEPKVYSEGGYRVQMIKYECGTKMFVKMDPPRYWKSIEKGETCKPYIDLE